MTNILLSGCNGKMGRMVTDLAAKDENTAVIAGVDAFGTSAAGYPVYPSFEALAEAGGEKPDVIVDFSNASALEGLLAYAVKEGVPCVLCTTGYCEAQLAAIKEASAKIPVLRSGNMSIGINLLDDLLKEAAAKLTAAGFDVEIIEKHHNQKVDAPSGTALLLADTIRAAAGGDYDYVYDRTTRREKRPKKEIGISAVRGGTIVGDHDVIFAGEDEVITFSHRAYSRAVFGKGALEAAKFLPGREPGMYDMHSVLNR